MQCLIYRKVLISVALMVDMVIFQKVDFRANCSVSLQVQVKVLYHSDFQPSITEFASLIG